MFLQDILRMPLTLALMAGTLADGIETWKDLFDLRQSADMENTGRRIVMKSEMLKLPVLVRMQDHEVTNNPVQTIDMQAEVCRLGLYCRFKHLLVAYCLLSELPTYLQAAQQERIESSL